MTSTQLNQIGLILGIVGVIIIFKWGPPQPNVSAYVPIAEQGLDLDGMRRRVVYKRMSSLGLGLVLLGFVAQFGATFLSP